MPCCWAIILVDINIFQKPYLNVHILNYVVNVQNLKGLSLL